MHSASISAPFYTNPCPEISYPRLTHPKQPDPRRPDVTDLPGICVPDEPTTCTGLNQCVSVTFLTQCYDWPLDGCDPENGDEDCIGLCLDPIPSSSSYPVKGY